MAKQVKSSKSKQGESKPAPWRPTKKTSIQGNGTNVNVNFKSNGKFAKDNKAAKGHSTKAIEKAKDFKRIFQAAVTCADMKAIAKEMVALAKKGNIKAAKEVLDRCMGKAIQPLEVGGKDGRPIQVNIINYAGASKK